MASVPQQFRGGSSRRPATLAPGELVWARITNGIENAAATGKSRPVVLIESRGSAWHVMGLTTNPRYRDGSPRVPIPDPCAVGLTRPGWLWGSRLCWVTGLDISDHVGWINEALAFDVIELAELQGPTIQKLLTTAHTHHGEIPLAGLTLVEGGRQ